MKNRELEKYKDIIEFLAIDHIYISAIVRIINADVDRNKRIEVINKLIHYIKKNFPNYKKNEYLSILPRNRKIVYKLVDFKFYSLIRIMFKIKRSV